MLDLILGRKLQPADFTFTTRAERPVELGRTLIPVMVQAYEARANETVLYRPGNAQQRLRNCYELQARLYARTVLGERREFEGVLA